MKQYEEIDKEKKQCYILFYRFLSRRVPGNPQQYRSMPLSSLSSVSLITVACEKGRIVRFHGQLLGNAHVEGLTPANTIKGRKYHLYSTETEAFVLVLEQYEKVQSGNFCLHFKTLEEVKEYLQQEKNASAIAEQLFCHGDGI